MADLIAPKEVEIEDRNGEKRVYIFSQPPYFDAREITSQWVSGAIPKVGDYRLNEEMAKKLFSYVAAIDKDGKQIRLTTKALVENHVPDLITGGRIELGMIEYILGFSVLGQVSAFLTSAIKTSLAKTSKT